MFPEIQDVDEKVQEELMKYFKGNQDGYVQVGPEKWFYPIKYKRLAQDYLDFEVRSDDIWITGIPRSGTTITQDLAYFMNNDVSLNELKKEIHERVVFFEHSMVLSDSVIRERNNTHGDIERIVEHWKKQSDKLRDKKNKRIIKTHLPFALLPPGLLTSGCKVVYVCRYPKDVAVSYFHLQKSLWTINYVGDFPKYWEFFLKGNCMFGPYFEHVRQGYEQRNNKNVLFVFYEDLKKDFRGYIQKFADFFERTLSEKEMEKLLHHFEFNNYKKSVNESLDPKVHGDKKMNFVREGAAGGWKSYFTEEMNEEADEWIIENCERLGFSYS